MPKPNKDEYNRAIALKMFRLEGRQAALMNN